MKKILSVLLAFSLVASLAFAAYDPETGKATFKFTKGWNLYPILGGENVGNNCGTSGEEKGGPPETFAYFYSPLSKKYWMVGPDTDKKLEEEQKTLGVKGKQYLYPFGGWFYYTKKNCEAWITYENGGINPFLDIAQGWQFVTKFPFMKQYSVTFGNCSIEKFNQWDKVAKDWGFKPSETSTTKLESLFNSAEPGEVFTIKFAKECTLGYSMEDVFGIPAPPSLE